MLTKDDIIGLKPTPVEKPLVSAIIRYQHAGWPYIYLAMKGVTKDDLLDDPEYCRRHRHPSLTQYFEECALFGGQGITMLRKYQRAGSLYERACEHSGGALPPITDHQVCSVSPDALILVARAAALLELAEGIPAATRDEAVFLLVLNLVEERGFRRRQMLKWLAMLEDAKKDGCLEQIASHFIAQVRHETLEESQRPSGGERIEYAYISLGFASQIRPFLDTPSWLGCLQEAEGELSGRMEIVDVPQVRNAKLRELGSDFLVVETITDDIAVHAVVVGSCSDTGEPADLAALAGSGVDYVWLASGSWVSRDADTSAACPERGLLEFDGKSLKATLPAKRLHPDPEARVALIELLLSERLTRSARKSKQPAEDIVEITI